MKYILLLAALVSFTLAETMTFTNDFTSVSTRTHQTIVEDKNRTISAWDIVQDRYRANYLKDMTSATKSVFWSKVSIANTTQKDVQLVFQNQRAGTDKIDVYIYQGERLIHTHTLGDLRPQRLRESITPKSVFHLDLPSHREYTVISRFENLGPMNLSWDILNEKKFLRKSSLEFLFNGLFAGVFIVLIVYNFMLYLSLKDSSFLIYILVTSSLLWIQYTYSGMFYFLDFGMDLFFLSISAWFVPYFYSGVLMLFANSFFKIYEKNRYIFYAFTALSITGFIFSLLSFLLFFDSSLALYTPYTYLYFYISLICIFLYALYATFKGHLFAIYFLIGEGIYLTALFYSVLVVAGVVEVSSGLQFFVPSAMALEALLFSIALSKRVKLLRQRSDANEILLVEESKFSAIGKGIGNVAHQWKTPLSQLNAHLLYLQGLYYKGEKNRLVEEFGTRIDKLGHIMNYMKSAIEEIHDFYSNVEKSETFRLKKQILLAMALQNDQLILNNISVNVVCDEELSLTGAKHGFANILMILFDNSIFQFEKNKTAAAKIDINVVRSGNKTVILFKDNAGGITITPKEKIFQMNVSTKGTEGCGLGLPLAKALSKKAIHGEISVDNRDGGALFTITVLDAHR